jgi:hypothetical protein
VDAARPQGRGEGSSREGEEGNECVRTDVPCPCGRWIAFARTDLVRAEAVFTASADGKNLFAGKSVSAK